MKAQLSECEAQGKLTETAKKEIISETPVEVLEQFMDEKEKQAVTALNAVDLDELLEDQGDGTLYGKQVIDLGDGCEAVVEVKDAEDKNIWRNLMDLIVEPSYAATNGEVLWKNYGDRYFTAKSTVMFGIKTCTMTLENHYNLSVSGITERYGSASGVNCTPGTVSITDRTATTPGSSDVNMKCSYSASSAGISKQYILKTTVGYMAKDATNKQIKVKHSWSIS
ncbi:hypothetical protein [Emergencia sp.]|uniref:hypothetical protein n=1 Tax=Emergencia sp. TaxID=1926557 RepID=UPI003AF184BF